MEKDTAFDLIMAKKILTYPSDSGFHSRYFEFGCCGVLEILEGTQLHKDDEGMRALFNLGECSRLEIGMMELRSIEIQVRKQHWPTTQSFSCVG